MSRTLLALCLVLSAASAAAEDAATANPASETCPKAAQHATEKPGHDEATPARRPGTPAPVRASSGGGGTVRSGPRWHSMLPGMIR